MGSGNMVSFLLVPCMNLLLLQDAKRFFSLDTTVLRESVISHARACKDVKTESTKQMKLCHESTWLFTITAESGRPVSKAPHVLVIPIHHKFLHSSYHMLLTYQSHHSISLGHRTPRKPRNREKKRPASAPSVKIDANNAI